MKGTLLTILILFFIQVDAQGILSKGNFIFEVGRNQNSRLYDYRFFILEEGANGIDREVQAIQENKIGYQFSITRLKTVGKKFAIRYGISLADKGFAEDLLFITNPLTTRSSRSELRNIQIWYLGVPLSFAFNMKENRNRVSFFADLGILSETPIAYNKAEYLRYGLKSFGLSYLFNTGLKLNFKKTSLLIGPQIRVATIDYYGGEVNATTLADFIPITTGFAIGYQLN